MSKERDLLERIRILQQENADLKDEANQESHSRLMAEEALGITEDRLQLALDAAGLASWEWDIAADVVFTSARFGQMVQGSADDASSQDQHWLPRDLMAKVVPEDMLTLRAAMVRTLKQQDDLLETEFRMQTANGIVWIECTGKVSARDMLGRAERMIGINRNITRRKQADIAMQLARDEAQEANRAKDEFLAHISHEIRTPLNGVIGMNNLLAQTELSKEQRKYVDLVASSGRALLALVNDVLDYSRFSAGGIVLEQVRFPLRRWLWEAVMPLQVTAQSKGLELTLSAAQDLPKEMVGDPGRMRQIVTNLVSNAVRFTERGSVQVSMSITPEQQLFISVQDTGIGIAPDKQKAIFDAFVQADSSTSRRYGGTGLGLAISMQLAQAMGGRIALESQAGQGSRFLVWIPLLDVDAGQSQQDFANTQLGGSAGETQPIGLNSSFPAHATPAQSPNTATAAPYAGQHALVADDHEVNRMLARILLEQLGFEVTLAEDGMQAIETVLQHKFDVIFMDIQMPQMNGWQATHELRQWEQQAQRARVPIIALSAHASAADREQALAIGMDGYLSKPLTAEALAAALRATRGGKSNTAPTLPLPPPPTDARPAPSHGSLQRERLLARLGGDEAALRDMARAMRLDLRERMGKAYEAMQAQDWPALHAQAHALKGGLASITADEAAAQAKQLEQCTDAAQASAVFQRLSLQAKQVFDALKNW
jgi:signal transduction histidine kinase/DNA-binding response OmpR family regulator